MQATASRENLVYSPTMAQQNTLSVRTPLNRPIVPPTTAPAMEGSSKIIDISSLMSPPELPPFETFSQSALSASPSSGRFTSLDGRSVPNPPLSPPISPFTKSTSCIDPVPTIREGSQDPILYPAADISPTPSQAPLFKTPENPVVVVDPESKRRVDQHVATRPNHLFQVTSPPEREEYELALYFKSTVMQSYTQNPRGWLRKERAILMADRRANMKAAAAKAKFQPILPAKVKQPSTSRVSKPKHILPVYRPVSGANNAHVSSATPRQHARTNSGALPKVVPAELPPRQRRESVASRKKPGSPTPEPRNRPVGPNREDKDFESLPDYCPPLSSVPDRPNCLKVDWKGNALDLSQDPFADLLHPEERSLAAGLRLDCATYLTSKRRIFIRRLECARIGKEFRKTDAQQACKIDVNKASKLWTAYDKINWLDMAWIQRHI